MENGHTKQKEKIKTLEIALRQIIQDKNNEIEFMKKAFFNANDKLKLQTENNSYSSDDFMQIIDGKNNEISSLRRELSEISKRYNSRILQEDANKQAIDGLLTNYSLEVQNEREKYNNEIRNLTLLIDEIKKENFVLKQENDSLLYSQRQRMDELNIFTSLHQENVKKHSNVLNELKEKESECNERIQNYERMLKEYKKKNYELEAKINECERMFEDYKTKIFVSEQRIKEQKIEIETFIMEKEKYINDAKINKDTYDEMIRTLSDTVTTQCDDIYQLMQINEKYEHIIKEKEEEILHLNEEFNQRTIELQKEYEIIQRKAIINPKDLELKFQAERMTYVTEITQLKRTLTDYQDRINRLCIENENLNQLSIERQKEINQWKLKNIDLTQKEDHEKLKIVCENLKKENIDLKEKNMKINTEKYDFESKLKRLMRENENSRKELAEAFEIIETLKDDSQNNKEIYGLKQKIQALNQRNSKMEDEYLRSKEELEKIEMVNGKLKSEICILKEDLFNKEEEYKKKTQEFNQKIKDLNELHKKYDRAINTFESENRISVLKKSLIKNDF